jgi:CRISPR-associated endonuclease/helicase Cas3
MELDLARRQLQSLAELSVGPDALTKLNIRVAFQHRHVLRRKDMIELFDTTPDLAGNDIDIDRYVRDTDDSDVRVFWRDLHATSPSPDEPVPMREELCPAPIGGPAGFRQFEDKLAKAKHLHLRRAYRRNYLRRTWEPVTEGDIFPGQTYLLDRACGGYDSETGWTGDVAKKNSAPITAVSLRDSALETDDSNDADPSSHIAVWQTIAEHTQDVCRELDTILHALQPPQAGALRIAARWHDWGKAHKVFQAAVRDGHPKLGPRPGRWIDNREIAKAPGKRDLEEGFVSSWWLPYGRPRFRHELVSALAIVQLNSAYIGDDIRDLVAYLVAAHHGKIRLSIRSLPGEIQPGNGKRFARGVWDGDTLTGLDLGGGVSAPAMVLSLQPMEIGYTSEGLPSWTEIALRIRDTFGPFRLAYLETLLRAADMRASQFAEMVAASSVRAEEVCHT